MLGCEKVKATAKPAAAFFKHTRNQEVEKSVLEIHQIYNVTRKFLLEKNRHFSVARKFVSQLSCRPKSSIQVSGTNKFVVH
jgi:hypothetical protein